MNIVKITTILGLLMLTATGCTLGSESPEKLITDKPIYNEENKVLFDSVSKMLVNTSALSLPSNSQDVGKINILDLDNDGIDEVIAFEKSKNMNTDVYESGFIILNKKSDGTYEEKAKASQFGDSIEYANFYDLDNDGNKEILLCIKNENKTKLYIYKYYNGKLDDSYSVDPTWIPNRNNLSDMKIKVGNINNDNILDIVMINYNYKNSSMYVSIANLNNKYKCLKLIDFTKFDNVKNINDLYITIGNLATKTNGDTIKGVVLDIPLLKDSAYFTQMLYIENGRLKRAFEDDDTNLMKSYYIPVEDINNDKVIDIPILNGSMNENTYTSKSSANITWYRWNGKDDLESKLLFNIQVYYNYEYNFKFLIPNNLANKISVEQEYNNNNVLFKFNYYNSNTKQSKNLFSIIASSKNIVEENSNVNLSNQNTIILKETEKCNFSLLVEDKSELNKLDIAVDALKDYFSLISE